MHHNYHRIDNSTPFDEKLERVCRTLQQEMVSPAPPLQISSSSSSLPATENCLLVVARQHVLTAAGFPMTVTQVQECWRMLGAGGELYLRALLSPLSNISIYSRKSTLGQLLSVKSRKALRDLSPEEVTNWQQH